MPTTSPQGALASRVLSDLRQGGPLAKLLPGYEERAAQLEMAALVAQTITDEVPAICEASTGTGKSLAYLIPIVRSGKRAIISTANKALQEQLFYKDIPFVQRHIQHFEAALVKGIGNYVCLDRLEEEEQEGMQFYVQHPSFVQLHDAINRQDFSGDFETLGFSLPADVRGRVCGDSDRCAWHRCSYFSECYIRKMREQAERAQVLVVNHTLLLLNAAAEGAILPEADCIVLDETHHLEEEATRAFTVTVKAAQVFTLLAQKTLRAHTPVNLQEDAAKCASLVWERLERLFPNTFVNRVSLSNALEEGLRLATLIGNLALALQQQVPTFATERDEILYKKLVTRTQNLAMNLRLVFAASQAGQYVYYLERSSSRGSRLPIIEASAAPLDVSDWLKELLFGQTPTIIMTSATLATVGPNPAKPEERGPNFAFFRRRIGLDPLERPDVLERILPLTFDYAHRALLYLPRDLPEPAYGTGRAAEEYNLAVARKMCALVQASRGRAFLLFSSRRMLDQTFACISSQLAYPLLRQGDLPRPELVRRFKEEASVLFGLKSFWEGIDIAGEALSLVVIDKLPFDPPDDPVQEARIARMKAAGENWFGMYVLPQAVLRLKQGVGRLLRTYEDRGVMAILDTRLYAKGYGRQILDALPPARRTDRLDEVQAFFR